LRFCRDVLEGEVAVHVGCRADGGTGNDD
jgi:hypothetical protein